MNFPHEWKPDPKVANTTYDVQAGTWETDLGDPFPCKDQESELPKEIFRDKSTLFFTEKPDMYDEFIQTQKQH